eukprot:TRINITY_DN59093_c0_g1_i1.p1 TRINITY_DN59093_c0_g1~~TRINITY_DN59093_c0_g1_i1.p1  ORF type:complete len:206 (-),score=17.80 TRINITY_DN59093_c0_g1_i1:131-748(-)
MVALTREKRKVYAVRPNGKEISEAVAKRLRGEPPEAKNAHAPLRWLSMLKRDRSIHDLSHKLTTEHAFVLRSKLPKNSHFSTTRSLETPKQWGHLVTVRGHHLAYVIGYQPAFSTTHGFLFVFSLQPGAGPALGPISATVQSTDSQDPASVVSPTSRFTWAEVPHAGSPDLEFTAGLFPVKLFTSRKSEGRPHERAVEVSIRCEG